tara:strand:+ start:5711 stop:7180 length:1470 start_codon:yes stop_codon:yes gene_type:complete
MKIFWNLILIFFLLAFTLSCNESKKEIIYIGDEPSIKKHISQSDIELGLISIEDVVTHGKELFTARFNSLDGFGRPLSAGDRTRRKNKKIFPENFNRISGPESQACSDCHNMPIAGGGGSNVTNVFSSAEKSPFLDFDTESLESDIKISDIGNERNTIGMFGSGLVELLAREMTKDLIAQRATAEALSIKEDRNVRILLTTKGVNFGHLTARPNGTIDTSEIEGVDRDLVIKPFTQKGVVVSLRVFTNNAMNHHHGMQSSERFLDREDVHKGMDLLSDMSDYDGDGVENELSSGDITAVTLFQATLEMPGRVMPGSKQEKEAVKNGEVLFSNIGCNSCHVENLPLKSLEFTDPSPFNPKNHLSPEDTNGIKVNLEKFFPNLERDSDGNYLIPLFSDLKRHNMGSKLDNEKVKQLSSRGKIDTNQWMTRKLWGFASEPPFLHHGRATLISEAIIMHGGDAEESKEKYKELSALEQASIVEYLKTFQIVNK